MRNLAAIQKAMCQSMKMNNAGNQVFNTRYGICATQGVEEENVDTGVPHARKRVLREDDPDVVEAPENLPLMDDRIVSSEKKGI